MPESTNKGYREQQGERMPRHHTCQVFAILIDERAEARSRKVATERVGQELRPDPRVPPTSLVLFWGQKSPQGKGMGDAETTRSFPALGAHRAGQLAGVS